jgi:serine/threonine protein phosphatase PrpC
VNVSAAISPATAQPAVLHLSGAMLSDVGLVRSHNEDSVSFVVPPERVGTPTGDSLLLVADGMGGHAAGDVASALAAEVVRRVYFELKGSVPALLSAAFQAAHKAIVNYAQDHPDCAGMGTTCTALAMRGNTAWLAHVGDSRAYLLRGSKLTQISEDQTLVRKLVKDGALTEEQAKQSDINNVLVQALGAQPDLKPQLTAEGFSLTPGDVLILCSDGLHGLVADEKIAEIAQTMQPLDACQQLIQEALAAGGHDNVSVGVFHALAVAGAGDNASRERTTRGIPVIAAASDDPAVSGTRRIAATGELP